MHQLILVSQSPRRKELLCEAGYTFQVDTVKVSEIIDKNLNLPEAIETLARQKAEAWVKEHKALITKRILLLSADTMVCLGESPMGKPKDEDEAFKMLRSLSGKMHDVITGICLWPLDQGPVVTAHARTSVRFKDLSDTDIWNYVKTGE